MYNWYYSFSVSARAILICFIFRVCGSHGHIYWQSDGLGVSKSERNTEKPLLRNTRKVRLNSVVVPRPGISHGCRTECFLRSFNDRPIVVRIVFLVNSLSWTSGKWRCHLKARQFCLSLICWLFVHIVEVLLSPGRPRIQLIGTWGVLGLLPTSLRRFCMWVGLDHETIGAFFILALIDPIRLCLPRILVHFEKC